MDSQRFLYNQYTLKRQILALTGKVRIFGPGEALVLYAEQKIFKWKEDIRLFTSDDKTQEVMRILARNIIDFSAAYDVIDSYTGMSVGALRRRGWRSMMRDHWEVFDPAGGVIATLKEDSQGKALARRLLFGSLLPQSYELRSRDGLLIGAYHQRLNLFRYVMDIELPAGSVDARLALAAGVLLAIIEGKQEG